jgi:hypothetical protein
MKLVIALSLMVVFGVSCRSDLPTTSELITLCNIVRSSTPNAASNRAGAVFEEFGRRAPKASTVDLMRALAAAEPKDKYDVVMKWAHRSNAYFECEEMKTLWQ